MLPKLHFEKYTNIRSENFNIVTEELIRISSVILKHCEAKVNFVFHFELIIKLNKLHLVKLKQNSFHLHGHTLGFSSTDKFDSWSYLLHYSYTRLLNCNSFHSNGHAFII